MNYKNIIKLLTSTSKFQINLGLERISGIMKLLGNPQEKIKIIHVAGTNGKGSVCAVLANILKCSGYRTGLYTSPHLIEYTERIKINNIKISKDIFSKLTEQICKIADENNINLTEFEILTACAFKYFADNNVDFAVIETGLGGRFDATNIVQNPVCSIITSISLDHTDRLGNTIEKIAFEKAGIIKQNSTVIVSEFNAGYEIIKNHALKVCAGILSAKNNINTTMENGINYAVINNKKYEFPLLGLYQEENLPLVISAIDLLRKKGYKISIEKGLKTVEWNARLQYIKEKNLLIDGAHNPSAAMELKKSLNCYFPGQKKIFIYGTISTKDYISIAKTLFSEDDEIYYYEFKHNNAVSFEEYTKNVPFLKNIKPYNTEVLQKMELKILTGSFYMIGEFIKSQGNFVLQGRSDNTEKSDGGSNFCFSYSL